MECLSDDVSDFCLTSTQDINEVDYNYFLSDEVTYLRDAHKQPSLNTLLSQETSGLPSLASLSLAVLTQNNPSVDKRTDHSSGLSPSLLISNDDEAEPLYGINRDDDTHSLNADFSPDDDSDYQPDDNISFTSCDSILVEPRKRAKRANKENWSCERNKNNRMKGKTYEGRRKTDDGKVVFDVKRQERNVKARCEHNDRSKFFECHKITEDMRQHIFKKYWKLSWEGKKVYIQQTVQKQKVARRKCSDNNNRREHTFKYNFNVSGTKVKVCKKMYLSTLDVGEWSVHNWVQKEDTEPVSSSVTSIRNINVQALEEIGRNKVKEFLSSLPKLESHYCRKSTNKLYLEQNWQSKNRLYREYVKNLTAIGQLESKVSIKIFNKEFNAMNLALFSPKKDQCDLCCSYKVGNVNQEIYNRHIQEKNIARREKEKDKELKDEAVKVFTFDLQAVLLSPALQASALYYKTKLKVHNFTIFDIQTRDAYCFIWHESEGGVCADEFCSILHYFINHHVDAHIKHIIFWSDGCTNQNRNAILANALLQVSVQKQVKITHKYLVKGHTQMECDSMHSTIERQLKNREIYSPAQYVEVCRTARMTKPYQVHYLQHNFFKKFNSMPYLNSIRPGRKTGETTVFELRAIEYRHEGKIFVKTEFEKDWEELKRRIKKPGLTDSMPPLYETRIAIPRSKYIHLQELKEVLPIDVHSFYNDLPHQCTDARRNQNSNICSCRRDVSRASIGVIH